MKSDRQNQLPRILRSGRKPPPARELVRRVLEILDGAPLTPAERALVARFERDDAERARRRDEARRARVVAGATAVAGVPRKESA
jgi:hypothetical protein